MKASEILSLGDYNPAERKLLLPWANPHQYLRTCSQGADLELIRRVRQRQSADFNFDAYLNRISAEQSWPGYGAWMRTVLRRSAKTARRTATDVRNAGLTYWYGGQMLVWNASTVAIRGISESELVTKLHGLSDQVSKLIHNPLAELRKKGRGGSYSYVFVQAVGFFCSPASREDLEDSIAEIKRDVRKMGEQEVSEWWIGFRRWFLCCTTISGLAWTKCKNAMTLFLNWLRQ